METKNLIECGTCGYPLTPEERSSLVEHRGRMVKEWISLTDEEMKQTCYETWSFDPYVIARSIEAKLKEKNT